MARQKPAAPVIREILRAFDMPYILDIETRSYAVPWAAKDFETFLDHSTCAGLLIEIPKKAVVGYMLYERGKKALYLHSIAIHPKYRRQGLGTRLVKSLLHGTTAQKRDRMETHVRERNLAAQLFLKSMGFRATKVVWGYFSDTKEDAFYMQCRTK